MRNPTTVPPNRFSLAALKDIAARLAALAVLMVGLSFLSKDFLSWDNLRIVGLQNSVIGICAVGETIIIIAGGIDLAVGSVMAFSGILCAQVLVAGGSPMLAALVGVGAGGLWGLFSGVATAKGKLPAFIATLGAMGMARGLSLVLANGEAIYTQGRFSSLAAGKFLGVPIPALLLGVVAVSAGILLTRTSFGRRIYALGGNPESARLSGINIDRMTIMVFVLNGLLTGLAGVVLTSRTGLGDPQAGKSAELDAIGAAVVGGASLLGGQGTISGAMIGLAIIAVIGNGIDLLASRISNPDFWQPVILGIVIVTAVLYDTRRRRTQK
ncbi:MAG TPA: ABC transporter permease [Armatimonadota bacterium]